jgi:DNA-binding NarL/FixJ family response regulator
MIEITYLGPNKLYHVPKRMSQKKSSGLIHPEETGDYRAIVYLDPKPLTRESIGHWLAAKMPDFQVISASSSEEILWLGRRRVDLALVLVNVEGGEATVPAWDCHLMAISRNLPEVPLALMANVFSPSLVAAASAYELRGLIATTMPGSAAQELIRVICAGGVHDAIGGINPKAEAAIHMVPEAESGFSLETGLPVKFTPRQKEILGCLKRGLPNKMIAHELQMREGTVKIHMRNIMQKLGARNRTQIVSMMWKSTT